MKQPKILFFLSGPVPTLAEQLEAFDLGVSVSFRNAQHVSRIDEECDGVAGSVPEAYEEFPTAKEALKAYKAEIKAAREKLAEVGGKPSAEQSGKPADDDTSTDDPQGTATGEQGTGTTSGPTDDEAAAIAAAAAAAAQKPPTAGKPAKGDAKPAGWNANQ